MALLPVLQDRGTAALSVYLSVSIRWVLPVERGSSGSFKAPQVERGSSGSFKAPQVGMWLLCAS